MMPFRQCGVVAVLVATVASAAFAQEKKEEAEPKTLLEEITWFAYVENSAVFNPRGKATEGTNELRLYDVDRGYTFNMAELSVKKDPSDRYPFGFGLVITGGEDVQFNHAIGIFRSADDAPADTEKFDLQEAYLAYRLPVGGGLTLKGGKFVTLLGYEVIESPNNLNFSRSFLFTFAIPLTHVGLLGSYSFSDALSVTAGPILGWDVATDRNGAPSGIGQVAYTPLKDLTTSLNFIVGPEKVGDTTNIRWVIDLVANYTGIKQTTLGFNFDYGREQDAAPGGGDAAWWGVAAYAAYDWTEQLRTAARVEYFRDADGVRTGFGSDVGVWEATATVQYKIWKGLVGRLEYRHDQADERAFRVTESGPTRKSQDTLAIALYYSFF
ncbi:MAG TPA: outer membrane beta-barrel protein [Methylomirabilota bacterium]|nr:outer membrane beta-barrel protein [Methylomirabilota bacterium]